MPSLCIIVVLVVLIGASQLTRPGYSVDEEFTVFAVRGIAAGGLPLLPSGFLYDRGLAYSYSAALIDKATGAGLPANRAISLASAVGALLLVGALMKRIATPATGLMAAAVVAASAPFWAAATTARFYGPFLAAYLGLLVVLVGSRSVLALFALSVVARLTHELAFTAAVIPVLCALLSARPERASWIKASLAVVAGLVTAQAAIFVFHYLAPSSGETMIKRFFLWQVLNLLKAPPGYQFGIVLVAAMVGWLIAPRRSRLIVVVALCGIAMVLGAAFSHALRLFPLSATLAASIIEDGSRYPFEMFWHIARTTPVSLGLALVLLVARLAGLGGEWRATDRAAHLLWIGWVVWFGVIESGITINYLLVPMSLMLAAIALDVVAVADHHSLKRLQLVAVASLVVAAVGADQFRGQGTFTDRLSVVRPTIHVPGIDAIRDGLKATDRVACTDELACLMLVGRVDTWLALDDFVRERFVVRRAPLAGTTEEEMIGVYAGSPAIFRPADLFGDLKDGRAPERVLIIDVFKEYPIGNSRDWLPRAIADDGLEVRTLLDTPQARVVQVSPPIRNASMPSGRPWCCGTPGRPTGFHPARTLLPQGSRHRWSALR